MKDSQTYTGYSPNLRERFKKHQKGQISSIKGRGSFKLIYYEPGTNKFNAMDKEKYLKTGMGKRYLKNRIKRSLSLTG